MILRNYLFRNEKLNRIGRSSERCLLQSVFKAQNQIRTLWE